MGKDVVAFLKLRIITEVLNEGWHPKFTEDEFRYYPWFYFYTTEGYNNFSEVVKFRCVGRANYDANADGGLVVSNALNASPHPKPDNGVCFVFSNRNLAEYAGMQFIDIWTDFVFKSNDNNKQ